MGNVVGHTMSRVSKQRMINVDAEFFPPGMNHILNNVITYIKDGSSTLN